ncbi:MAG: c-type cytochrome [Candidatus Binataceae bacterium]
MPLERKDEVRVPLIVISYIVAAAVGVAVFLAVVIFLAMPRMYWGTYGRPGPVETFVSRNSLRGWIGRNAPHETNPLKPTSANLKAGQEEFDEHCAFCHGYDGSARNLVGANFYPPVAKLQKGGDGAPDGVLFYIVANGIRMTAMPGFGKTHSPEDLWKIILWVRHFPHLTPQEKATIATEMRTGPMQSQAQPGQLQPSPGASTPSAASK